MFIITVSLVGERSFTCAFYWIAVHFKLLVFFVSVIPYHGTIVLLF